jgi:hypothetical protein
MMPTEGTELYRAVSDAELADIISSGEYRVLPGAVEGKYFVLSLTDARYFRDQVIIDAAAIVRSSVAAATFAAVEHGVFDGRNGVFARQDKLTAVNADARRFGGIRRVE